MVHNKRSKKSAARRKKKTIAGTKKKPELKVVTVENDEFDNVWGLAGIGKEINATAEKARWLIEQGLLDGCVKKIGHRSFVASRRKLREFFANAPDIRPAA